MQISKPSSPWLDLHTHLHIQRCINFSDKYKDYMDGSMAFQGQPSAALWLYNLLMKR
ncbi:unnamed protein product [Rhodiola kirilowii]